MYFQLSSTAACIMVFALPPVLAKQATDAGVTDAGVTDEVAADAGVDASPADEVVEGKEPRNLSPAKFEESDHDGSDTWDVGDGLAGTNVRVHGSYENQLNGMWIRKSNGNERVSLYDSNRLRLDVDADLAGGLEIRSNAVARVIVGEKDIALLDLIPPETYDALLAQDARWEMIANDKYQIENEYYIDNAYIKIPISKALLTVGKQPLEQGAGYAWNPTDVFTEKNIFDPTYEKPGIVAARLLIPIGEIGSLDLIGVPDGHFEKWTGGGRGSLRLGPISISVVSFLTRVAETDLEGSIDNMITAATSGRDPEEGILKGETRRVLVGGDIVVDIEGVRIWSEGAYNFVDRKPHAPDNWWELTAGLEYFFPFETHIMAEYFHYGRGPGQKSGIYSFNDWSRLLAGELKMLGRDFLFESIDHPVSDFWTLGLSSFQAMGDGSAVIMADVRWEFVQDAEIWLVIAANVGERSDFLASTRGQSWLRLKAYF